MNNTVNSKFNFSRTLKILLSDKKMSQVTLARKSGFSPGYINDLVMGQRTNPEIDTILKITQALEVDPIEFFVLSLETNKCKSEIESGISNSLNKFEHLLNHIQKNSKTFSTAPVEM